MMNRREASGAAGTGNGTGNGTALGCETEACDLRALRRGCVKRVAATWRCSDREGEEKKGRRGRKICEREAVAGDRVGMSYELGRGGWARGTNAGAGACRCEAGGTVRARQRHHLTGAAESGGAIFVQRRGWGYFARLSFARGWFERAIERAPGDVATSERRAVLLHDPIHGRGASFLKPYGQDPAVLLGCNPEWCAIWRELVGCLKAGCVGHALGLVGWSAGTRTTVYMCVTL